MSLYEAVDVALPMLHALGNDVEDSVRETFVVELDKIIMYYYRVSFGTRLPVLDAYSGSN